MRKRKLLLLIGLELCFLALLGLLLVKYPALVEPQSSEEVTETAPPQTCLPPPTEIEPPETTVPETTAPAPTQTVAPEPQDADFVKVTDYIPDAVIDLAYATENNFTGKVIYDFSDCYLRYGTVKKLIQVQEKVKESGYRLKIWDGFRPFSAQEKLWQICPDPAYVSNPATGSNSHCKGNTVDITLVYLDGSEVEMPTGFDDFSALADRDYSDCPAEAKKNAEFLEDIMKEAGFKPYFGEWWHFSDTTDYPVDKEFLKIQ